MVVDFNLTNNRKRYLGSYSNPEDAAAAFAFAKSFQNEELPKQEVFSELFGRIKYSNKPETYKRKRETVRLRDMYCEFGDIYCQFSDIYCEFGDTYCEFGDMYCEFGDIYYILPKFTQPT